MKFAAFFHICSFFDSSKDVFSPIKVMQIIPVKIIPGEGAVRAFISEICYFFTQFTAFLAASRAGIASFKASSDSLSHLAASSAAIFVFLSSSWALDCSSSAIALS